MQGQRFYLSGMIAMLVSSILNYSTDGLTRASRTKCFFSNELLKKLPKLSVEEQTAIHDIIHCLPDVICYDEKKLTISRCGDRIVA